MNIQANQEDTRKEVKVESMGEIIRRLRLERGLTMAELGVYSRTSEATVSLLEAGKRNASARTVQNLADALGVEPGELYPKDPAPTPRERVAHMEGHFDSEDEITASVSYSDTDIPGGSRLEKAKGTLLRAVLEDLRDGRTSVDHAEQTILQLTKI
jgi:transcriptional regulator with XRE-family HTH domain